MKRSARAAVAHGVQEPPRAVLVGSAGGYEHDATVVAERRQVVLGQVEVREHSDPVTQLRPLQAGRLQVVLEEGVARVGRHGERVEVSEVD